MLFIFIFFLLEKKCSWNSRWKWIQEQRTHTTTTTTKQRTRNPSIILLYSAFTLICWHYKKRYEMRRKEKKCLEFASIYTHILCDHILSPLPTPALSSVYGVISLQSLLNMFMRFFFFAFFLSLSIAIHFLSHHRFQSFFTL